MDVPSNPVHPHGRGPDRNWGSAREHNLLLCDEIAVTPHPSSYIFIQITEYNVIGSWTSSPPGLERMRSSTSPFLVQSIVTIFRSLHSNITSSRLSCAGCSVAPLHAVLTGRVAFLNTIGENIRSRPRLPQSGRMCPSPRPLDPPMTSAECCCPKVAGTKEYPYPREHLTPFPKELAAAAVVSPPYSCRPQNAQLQ